MRQRRRTSGQLLSAVLAGLNAASEAEDGGNWMSVVVLLLKVVISAFMLSFAFRLSHYLLFFNLRKPFIWIVFVGCLGFLWFLVGSILHFSLDVVAWSAIAALAMNEIPKSSKTKSETIDFADEFTGVANSRLKSRAGSASFVIGSILGWILFWGEYCSSLGECQQFFW